MSQSDNLPVLYEGGVTVFNDHDVMYMTGGERSEEYLWMENIPEHMENHA